jgi:hypothetical protein
MTHTASITSFTPLGGLFIALISPISPLESDLSASTAKQFEQKQWKIIV